ncbi:unnamed protein product [Hyaloperonospora brassicae]|uniref:RxLR effector protein n=1 Tax=Hyaloperonospora brassicae TaxID=162125 RepID=A0AAV0TB83_HYABA|nr:unnamed protein product [Hyaloperonospora brassicae]
MMKSFLLLVLVLTMSAVYNADAGPAAGTKTTLDLTSAVHHDRNSKSMLRGTDGFNEASQEERGLVKKIYKGVKKTAKAVGKGVVKTAVIIKDKAEDYTERLADHIEVGPPGDRRKV